MQSYTLAELKELSVLKENKFYFAQHADERIAALERALNSTAHVLSQMMLRNSAMDGLAKEALNEADKALALMGS
jgi:hypothetical protein